MQLSVEGVNNPFVNARDYAFDVIQNGGYSLESTYEDVFATINENGRESIFEIQFIRGPGTGYYFEGCGAGAYQAQRQGESNLFMTYFMPRFQGFESVPGSNYVEGWGFNIPTYSNDPRNGIDGVPLGTGILEAFETGDTRKDFSIYNYREQFTDLGLEVNAELSLFNVYKYRQFEVGVNGDSDNYFLLRLPDVYLMFAEAENEINGGPTSDAYFYINEVRKRAFQDTRHDLSALNYDTFLDAIYHERRMELCFEGQRWFDLIRRPQRAIEVMMAQGKTNVSLERLISPIPQVVIDQSNGRIMQNPGY